METKHKAIVLALFCTLIVSVAQILLKMGSASFQLSWDQIYNYPFVIGVVLYGLGSIIFIKAFRIGELSLVYPIMAFGYVIVTLLSIYFLAEVVSFPKIGGIILITFGVITIGRGGKE